MKRYLIQHQMLHANPTAWADTIDEAKAKADRIWGPHCVRVRQEISDEDGYRLIRYDGRPDWDEVPQPRWT